MPSNPADDPKFLSTVINEMEEDLNLREGIHETFQEGNLSWLLHSTQLEIYNNISSSDSNEFLIFSSRQLGKSMFSLIYAIEFCLKNPNETVRIFANSEKQSDEIVENNLALLLPLFPKGLIKATRSSKKWKIGESTLRLHSLEKAHVDKARGVNAGLIICEEGGFVLSENYSYALSSVIGHQLLRSQGKLIHITTPSKNINHTIHINLLPKMELKGTLFRYDIYSNPQLSPDQIKSAYDLCDTEEDWEREYLVKITKDLQQTVIPGFDISFVKESELPKHFNSVLAIDVGGTLDKHGLVSGYFDYDRKKTVIHNSLLLDPNTSTDDLVAQAKNLELNKGSHKRIVDAQGQNLIDIRRQNFPCQFPKKGKGSFEAGINKLRGMFKRNEIEIRPRNKLLIKTLESGLYNSNRTDFQRSKELGHLDALAALIYLVSKINKTNPYPDNYGLLEDTHYIHSSPKKSLHEQLQTIVEI